MGVDLIKGLDPSGEPRAFRVTGVKDAFTGTTPIPDNSSLQSAVTFVGDFPYFVSEIKADRACTLTLSWYSDQAGTTLIDTDTYTYATSQGLRVITGPIASDFLRVTISNSSGANMTAFSHRLKLSPSPNINLVEVETNQEEQLVAIAAVQTEINDELLATRNTIESVGEELEVNETAEHTLTRTQILAVQTEINDELATTRATIESVGEELEIAEAAEHTLTRATIESVGEELEVQINLVTTEVNDELLATRNHITSDGALTRTQIDLATAQLVAVNTELDTQTTALGTVNSNLTTLETSLTSMELDLEAATTQLTTVNAELDAQTALLTTIDADTGSIDTKLTTIDNKITSDGALTRATVESVGEEIETALAIQHPRIIRQAYDQIGVDAGGRIRVSQFTTLMDGKVVNGHTPLIFESAGTGTFSLGSSKNNMSVTSGQWCVFQTRRFYPYFSGKSQAIEETFDGFAPEANVIKRFGYFSSSATSPFDTVYDGMWCESDGTTINLRMARAGTSTLNLPITSWSGYANLGEYQNLANWNNFTVCLFDFLWLGGAVMRFWVKTQSGFVLAHVFNYAGTTQDVFMLCPCHPVRYEIRSTTGSGSFRYICSQVATEGSFEEDGIVRATTTGVSAITCATSGTVYPLIALRKQSAFRGVASRISDFNLFVTSPNDQLLYTIQINPTLSAPLTYGNVANSSMQSAIGNGTITVTAEGTVMASGFLTQNSILPTSLLQNNFLSYMGGTLANVMDEYVLCATPLSGVTNAATYASMAYKEY